MSKIFTIADGLENLGALRTGGQGSVYKGRRVGPILSAVKILPTPVYTESLEDHNYRNFLNEVDKLKKVNQVPNPNVVKILNSGITESGSFPFIEMEFIEGPDLEELVSPPHDKIFLLKDVIKVADNLAAALAHCHKFGIKHGDIKSNNVKFNINSGNYVLLDFGLSIMSDEQRRTSMRLAGAVEFMAPEQSEGQMLFQTDIYSYGIVLYELLAGQVPFPLSDSGETARNNVIVAHRETPVPDLLELRSQNMPESWSIEKREQEMRVSQWLLNLINKCLEKKPEDRYHDGVVLQEALFSSAGYWYTPTEDGNILKDENTKLKDQLRFYGSEANRKKKVNISVFVAIVFAFAAVFLGMVIGRLLTHRPVVYQVVEGRKPYKPFVEYNLQAIEAAKKARQDSIKKAQKQAKLKQQRKQPIPAPKTKKRKKFLGIF